MLKKLNRLVKKKDFDNIYKKGRSSFDKIIGVKTLKNDLDINRFGIVVSSKVSRKAVERNKIKRRLREALRPQLEELKPGNDLVIISLPEIIKKDFNDIHTSLRRHLYKLYLYKTTKR